MTINDDGVAAYEIQPQALNHARDDANSSGNEDDDVSFSDEESEEAENVIFPSDADDESGLNSWDDVLLHVQQANLKLLPKPDNLQSCVGTQIIFCWSTGWFTGVVHSRTNQKVGKETMNYFIRYSGSDDLQAHKLTLEKYVDSNVIEPPGPGMYVFVEQVE